MSNAYSDIPNFDPNMGASLEFQVSSTHFIYADNAKGLNPGVGNFSISWWQFTSENQLKFPRIIQFGEGSSYSDKFAISEENDGNIYLWINGVNISSISIPSLSSWHHISIIRENQTFRWFVDGVFVKQSSSSETFNTSSLKLLIGGGNDSITGSFMGLLAGVQIVTNVRWPGTSSFTPPTNFLTPDIGAGFSLYVEELSILDKATSPLTIQTNVAIARSSFVLPAPTPTPTPDPTPTPTPEPTPEPTVNCDPFRPSATATIRWDETLMVTKPTGTPAECSFAEISKVLLEIPIGNTDANNPNPHCLLNFSEQFTISDTVTAQISLPPFWLIWDYYESVCLEIRSSQITPSYDFGEYTYGLFGNGSIAARIHFWQELNLDSPVIVSSANDTLRLRIVLPPEFAGYDIIREEPSDLLEHQVLWGDSIRVIVTNFAETEAAILWLYVPEIPGDSWCPFELSPVVAEEAEYGIPSLSDFQEYCNEYFHQEGLLPAETSLILNPEINHELHLVYEDVSNNYGMPIILELQALEISDPEPTPTPTPTSEPSPTPTTTTSSTPEPLSIPEPKPTPQPFLRNIAPPKIKLQANEMLCISGIFEIGFQLLGQEIEGSRKTLTANTSDFYLFLDGTVLANQLAIPHSQIVSWTIPEPKSGALYICSQTVMFQNLSLSSESRENTKDLVQKNSQYQAELVQIEFEKNRALNTNAKQYLERLNSNRTNWRLNAANINAEYELAVKANDKLSASRDVRRANLASLKLRVQELRKNSAIYAQNKIDIANLLQEENWQVMLDAEKRKQLAKDDLREFYATSGYGILIP